MSKMGLNKALLRFESGKRTLIGLLVKSARAHFQRNFVKQGFDGKGWDALKRPRPDGSTTPILVDTGNLRGNIRERIFSRNMGNVIFNAPYASYHNEGNPKTNLPQRKFAGKSRALDAKANKIILSYIKRKLR